MIICVCLTSIPFDNSLGYFITHPRDVHSRPHIRQCAPFLAIGYAMGVCWTFAVYFCNGFIIFGTNYFMELPVGLQNEIMGSRDSVIVFSHMENKTNCRLCYGLGEVRYNLIFGVLRWTSCILCLPLGFAIDRLGNCRSAILFSSMPLLGSVMFAIAVTIGAPATTPQYIVMVLGYTFLAFADGALRAVRTRVIGHCFPDSTFTGLAFATLGHLGETVSLFLTPYLVVVSGPTLAAWTATGTCGLSVLSAIGMTLLLQHHTPDGQTPKDAGNKLMTLKELRAVPVAFWFYTLLIACTAVCWVTKQANLPDYLQLLHGYTMEEASRITGLAPLLMNCLVPFICVIMWKIDNNGIMFTAFTSLMVPQYYLLGFCPAANIYVITCLNALRITVAAVMIWKLVIVQSPPSYVGTLVMIMFTMRNIVIAVVSVATGYILQRHKVTTLEVALTNYQHYFIMLLTLSSTGIFCGVLMNVVDFRKGCSLNGRLKRWMESGSETTRLIAKSESDKYYGVEDINKDGVNEDIPMRSVLKTE